MESRTGKREQPKRFDPATHRIAEREPISRESVMFQIYEVEEDGREYRVCKPWDNRSDAEHFARVFEAAAESRGEHVRYVVHIH